MKYKLKDIFDLQMGKTPSRNNSEYWDTEDYKWISIADLSKNGMYILDTKEYLSEKAILESGIKVIPANTVVMSFKLSIGKTAITVEDMYSNEAIMSFHDKHIVEILPEYIFYMFKYKNWDEGSNKAVMGKTLNKATLSETVIEICSIEKQKEIVNILNKMTCIIEKRQQELSELDTLIKARFVEMFGDPISNSKDFEVTELKDILKLKAGDFTPASDISDKKTPSNPYPCFGGNGIRGYVADYNQEGEYTLIGRQGALSGNVKFASGKFKNTEHALLVTPLIEMNSVWLNQLLVNLRLKRYQTGAAQPGLSVKNLLEIPIISVPLSLQNEFAAFVQQIDKLRVVIQKSLDEAQYLFDSLMQEYFG
ncbi:restriction endonuclease subunit S [uncultured Enterococcus sp.]|uniref:restriction endonuclease subunit S n=1 Tax=uncultured Enterococcus sp. TaxID=167972 RepID=UPI002627E7D5|nr:restriction endonuclease subunit S [uncultured Enterococcus sp.]